MEIVKNIKKPIQKEINGENIDVSFAKEICAVDKGVYYGQPSDVNVIAVQTTGAKTGIMNFMVAVYVKKEAEDSRTKTDIVFASSAKGELLSNDERRAYFDIVRTAALRVSPLARRISMEHWRNKKKE
jgi:hypothetical protein